MCGCGLLLLSLLLIPPNEEVGMEVCICTGISMIADCQKLDENSIERCLPVTGVPVPFQQDKFRKVSVVVLSGRWERLSCLSYFQDHEEWICDMSRGNPCEKVWSILWKSEWPTRRILHTDKFEQVSTDLGENVHTRCHGWKGIFLFTVSIKL